MAPRTPDPARKTSDVPIQSRPIERWRPVPRSPARPPAARGRPELPVVAGVAVVVSISGRVLVIAMVRSGLYSSQPAAKKLVGGDGAEQEGDVGDGVREQAHRGCRRGIAQQLERQSGED